LVREENNMSRTFTIGSIHFELRGHVLIADGEPVLRDLTEEDISDINFIADVADKHNKEKRHD
jgi:hypothetical protein